MKLIIIGTRNARIFHKKDASQNFFLWRDRNRQRVHLCWCAGRPNPRKRLINGFVLVSEPTTSEKADMFSLCLQQWASYWTDIGWGIDAVIRLDQQSQVVERRVRSG